MAIVRSAGEQSAGTEVTYETNKLRPRRSISDTPPAARHRAYDGAGFGEPPFNESRGEVSRDYCR